MPAADRAVEFLEQVAMPHALAVLRFQAYEIALLAERINVVAVDGRRAAEVAAGGADVDGPDELAVVPLQGDCFGDIAFVAKRVDAVADDAEARIAAAQVFNLPGEQRGVLGPRLKQAGFLGDVIAVRAAELGPIRGRR